MSRMPRGPGVLSAVTVKSATAIAESAACYVEFLGTEKNSPAPCAPFKAR